MTAMAEKARNLYLDLLIKILLNTIYEDASINPRIHPLVSEQFDSAARSIGRDWPTQAHTMVGRQRHVHRRIRPDRHRRASGPRHGSGHRRLRWRWLPGYIRRQ